MNILSLVMASQQLFHVDRLNDTRIESAQRLDACLREIPGFSPPVVPEGTRHVYHMYRFRFDPAAAGMSVSADQAREALKRVFAAEGLPLVEFQNRPLAGHALLQREVGYGSGCPWTCHGRGDMVYRSEDYPASLDVIRHSLVIGMPAQATLANPEVIDAYLRAFRKVLRNMPALERLAARLPSVPPWSQPARIF
jgi:dTDP-4-amino-4,6-dideoxygalactose transaminase